MGHQPKQIYEFGPYRLDAAERLLMRDSAVVPLQPKIFDLLLALVERHGRLLEKDELMKLVWPDTFVEEGNLANNISILRKTLSENGERFIETVPKRGYRFVAPVREQAAELVVADATPAAKNGQSSESSTWKLSRWARRRPGLTALLLILLLAGLTGAFGYQWQARQAKPAASNAAIRSIAVLPFKPLSRESQDETLQMGMAETLILKLSNLKQLSVRSISSVSKYANPDQDPLAAGRELKADFVLESSFQRNGEKIRVTSRLVNPADGTAIWIYHCDEEYCANLFVMEDAIAGKVAAALSLQLTGVEQERLRKHYTENREAHQLYMRGRFYWNKRTEDGLKKGIECFQHAVDMDPNYALAYAGLAECYITLVGGAYSDPEEFIPKAKAYAVKAMEIDNELAEAHSTLAGAKGGERDWLGAEKEYKLAIYLDPGYATAHQRYSYLLMWMGRFEESLAEIEQALALDPVSISINSSLAQRLYFAGQYAQAIEQLRKTLEMDPNFLRGRLLLGAVYTHTGKYAEAIAELNKAAALSRDSALAALGYTYAVSGEKSKARRSLAELQEMSKRRYVSPVDVAAIYAGLGEKDQAFAWLEKGFQGRAIGILHLKIDPKFDSLRPDSRFADMLRRIGLAP